VGLLGQICGLVRQSPIDQVQYSIGVRHQPLVVTNQEQNRASVVFTRVQQPDDLLAVAPVERACRLVGEAKPRPFQQGSPHRHALLLPTRKLVGAQFGSGAQRELFEHLGNATTGLKPRRSLTPADDHRQLLAGRERGKQIETLEDEAETTQPKALAVGLTHPPKVIPQDHDLASIWPQEPRQQREQGGLAASGRTLQEQYLAWVQLERNIAKHMLDRVACAERAFQIAGDQDGLRRHRGFPLAMKRDRLNQA
jgi:hypothetical protein